MGHTLGFKEGSVQVLFVFLIFVAVCLCLGLMFQATYEADVGLFLVVAVLAVAVWGLLMFRWVIVNERSFSDNRRSLGRTFQRLRETYGDSFFEVAGTVFLIRERRSWGRRHYVLQRQVQPILSNSTQEIFTEFFIDSPLLGHVYYKAYKKLLLHTSLEEGSPFGMTTFAPSTTVFKKRISETELQALTQQLKAALPKQEPDQ